MVRNYEKHKAKLSQRANAAAASIHSQNIMSAFSRMASGEGDLEGKEGETDLGTSESRRTAARGKGGASFSSGGAAAADRGDHDLHSGHWCSATGAGGEDTGVPSPDPPGRERAGASVPHVGGRAAPSPPFPGRVHAIASAPPVDGDAASIPAPPDRTAPAQPLPGRVCAGASVPPVDGDTASVPAPPSRVRVGTALVPLAGGSAATVPTLSVNVLIK